MNEDDDGERQLSAFDTEKLHERVAEGRAGGMLGTTVVEAVAEEAGVTPTEIETPLYEVVDPDALDALFAPCRKVCDRNDGSVSFPLHGHYVTVTADGTIKVQSELARLKQTGGNLLVTGEVPDEIIDTASVQLLGRNDGEKAHVVALHDRSVTTATERLSRAGADRTQAHVLDYSVEARSVAASQSTAGSTYRVTDIEGSLPDLRREIDDSLWSIASERCGLAPGELRFCFDSLRPLLDEYPEDEVKRFLAACFDTVESLSGMGHYVLPTGRDSKQVDAIERWFDATVELRIGNSGAEQRWHLFDTDFTTEWFPLQGR